MKKKRKIEPDFSGKLLVRAVVMGSGLPIRVLGYYCPSGGL
jgi:hypothetical protein